VTKKLNKLKKEVILEFIIIIGCFFVIGFYIVGIISPNIYFSNFLLSTIQTIFAVVLLIIMLQQYNHNLKLLDNGYEKRNIIRDTISPFWFRCFITLLIICSTTIAGIIVLLILDIFFSLHISDITMIIYYIIGIISCIGIFTIIIITERKEKQS